jgi:hypothetical protein
MATKSMHAASISVVRRCEHAIQRALEPWIYAATEILGTVECSPLRIP